MKNYKNYPDLPLRKPTNECPNYSFGCTKNFMNYEVFLEIPKLTGLWNSTYVNNYRCSVVTVLASFWKQTFTPIHCTPIPFPLPLTSAFVCHVSSSKNYILGTTLLNNRAWCRSVCCKGLSKVSFYTLPHFLYFCSIYFMPVLILLRYYLLDNVINIFSFYKLMIVVLHCRNISLSSREKL